MAKLPHTPGPWRASARWLDMDVDYRIGAKHKELVEDSPDGDEIDANIRLITAAPELLAALELVIYHHVRGVNPLSDAAILSARAAIAKAKG